MNEDTKGSFDPSCPIPREDGRITSAHGGGGRLMHRLIREVFRARFEDASLDEEHDGAVLPLEGGRLAFTTDSFVVRPLFFPGGDIGKLAVCGTANDLAMCAAEPLYLSCGFIVEEGLPLETLERVALSMRNAAKEAGVRLVTGDTKVVERGKGDGLYLNTAGVGRPRRAEPVLPSAVRSGDAVLLSGDVGAHAAAVLSVREGLDFETVLESDCAPLWPQVAALLEAGVDLHCLRDLTRGGLAMALNEIAETAGLRIAVSEEAVPVRREVAAACELLGLDPLYMACEGRFIAFVPQAQADLALKTLAKAAPGQRPALLGHIAGGVWRPRKGRRAASDNWNGAAKGEVVLKTRLGVDRVLDMLTG